MIHVGLQGNGAGPGLENISMERTDHKPHINVDYFEDLTGEIESTSGETFDEIGVRLKTFRQEKGLSLDELSHLTGFHTDLLAGIEAGDQQPQLGTIIKLSKALDVAFSRIVSGAGKELYAVIRKGDRRVVQRSTSRKGQKQIYTYNSLASDVKGRHMEPLVVQLEEAVDDVHSVHDGEEFIYVMDGVARLLIGGETYLLEPGDTAYYLSTTPHLISADSGTATILAVLFEG